MSGLNVEQKARAYDEALKYAKSALDCLADDYICNHLTKDDIRGMYAKLFPELGEVEDEDEKIRKNLIGYIKGVSEREVCKETLSEWIAWLEKQDKRDARYKYLEKLLEADTIYQMAMNDAMVEEAKAKALEAISNMEIFKLFGFEKQGEPIKDDDKAEPRFKEGDWLVHNERRIIIKVVKSNPLLYKVVDTLGYHHTITDDAIESNYHLWTIRDAKDGDVLACNEELLLFKSYSVQGRISLYCWYNGRTNHFHSKEVDTLLTTINNVWPSTKEQHDTFMKAMADAGWEFDLERKALKKIGQSPAEEYSFNIESELFNQLTKEQQELWRKEIEQAYNVGADSQKLSEWSEDDETKLTNTIIMLKEGASHHFMKDDIAKAVDWLKSIRPQPKQEWSWSEDDEQYLLVCKNALAKYQASDKWDATIISQWLENKLKSLRTQWKPSEEQIYWLDWAVNRMSDTEKGNEARAYLEELLEQLRTLYYGKVHI